MSAPDYPHGYGYNAPSNGIDLTTVPKALLAYVISYFGQAGVELPDRQMLTAGPAGNVAFDCEQLTVTLDNVGWGRARDATQISPGLGRASSVNSMRHGEFVVTLVRCWANSDDQGNLIDSDTIEDQAENIQRDAGLLSQALVNFAAFQQFNDQAPLSPGGSTQAGAVSFVGPSGGYIGINGSFICTIAELNPPAPGVNY